MIRPAFVGLLCPALTQGVTHRNLLGPQATQTEINARSPSHRIPKDVPPCFIAHARDDAAVCVTDSEEFLAALNANGPTVEAHSSTRARRKTCQSRLGRICSRNGRKGW
ncbi:MAG: hypothetical protein ACOVVK_11940 [Elsteraceae bacterium]